MIGWQQQITRYTYDGDGLRTKKTAPDGTVTTYLWDHSAGLPLLLGEKIGTSQTYWVNGPGGLPVEEIRPDNLTVRYYHHDQIGSTRLITDQTGTNIGSATYDPYGKLVGVLGVTTPLGFAGQYTDTETGYQYLRARYYDPNTGQFLTRDPLVTSTRSPYGYVAGNPLTSIDPTGLSSSGGNAPPGKHLSALDGCFHPNSERLQIGPHLFRPSNWFSKTRAEKNRWIEEHITNRIKLVDVDQGGANYNGSLCIIECFQATLSFSGDGVNVGLITTGVGIPGASASFTVTTKNFCQRSDETGNLAGGAGFGITGSTGIKQNGEPDLYDNEVGAGVTTPGISGGPGSKIWNSC